MYIMFICVFVVCDPMDFIHFDTISIIEFFLLESVLVWSDFLSGVAKAMCGDFSVSSSGTKRTKPVQIQPLVSLNGAGILLLSQKGFISLALSNALEVTLI